jgi:uncharacterized protein YbjT (DUF2867 family)
MAFKNVALTGASGSVGAIILEKLLAAGTFNVTVLRRAGSKSTFPAGVTVVDADFDSVDSLAAALKGQEVLVSAVTMTALLAQKTLVDASVAAGVRRFIPSEYGCDVYHPKAKTLPVFAHKVEVEEYIFQKAKESGLEYTFVFNNCFLDWGLQHDFILRISDYKPVIYDDGETVFSSTNVSTVADGIVGILNHPEETKNRPVYIKDVDTTQNQLLALAKKAAPEKPWAPVHVKLDDVTAAADARLAQGLLDLETFAPYIFRSVFDASYGGRFDKTDNELLGIKGKTEEELFEIVKAAVK